MIEPSYSTLAH